MNVKATSSVGSKLYPDQKEAWDAARGDMDSSEALREAMRMYCESRGVHFPMYETGGRGGDRVSEGKKVVTLRD